MLCTNKHRVFGVTVHEGGAPMNVQFLSKEEFVNHVANDCLEQLTVEDKIKMKANPDPTLYHFGLGMFLRNNYIYGNKRIKFEIDSADDLSGEIIDRMMSILRSQQKK